MGNSQHKNFKKVVIPRKNDILPSTSVRPPSTFMSEEEFFKFWPVWKKDFLLFKRLVDVENINKQRWGNMLLNIMGPVGQNIYDKFIFDSATERENIDVLFEKFDEYFLFSGKTKLPLENVYEYVKNLQLIVKNKNVMNEEKVIRKKILTEIDKQQFANAAKDLIPTFMFPSSFDSLTIKEIAFIWNLYNDNLTMPCIHCGYIHISKKCAALGKTCSTCNKPNHFSRRCPTTFIFNCNYCKSAHQRKNCPSFGETCTKCHKSNHFSWMCNNQILHCHFCGLTHAASRSTCPALNTICSKCKMTGHFVSKCKQRS